MHHTHSFIAHTPLYVQSDRLRIMRCMIWLHVELVHCPASRFPWSATNILFFKRKKFNKDVTSKPLIDR